MWGLTALPPPSAQWIPEFGRQQWEQATPQEGVFYHWHCLEWLAHDEHESRLTFNQFYYYFWIIHEYCTLPLLIACTWGGPLPSTLPSWQAITPITWAWAIMGIKLASYSWQTAKYLWLSWREDLYISSFSHVGPRRQGSKGWVW